jgi:hypothetical protein
MNLTDKQIETVKVLAGFDGKEVEIHWFKQEFFQGQAKELQWDYLTDLNKLAELYRKLYPFFNSETLDENQCDLEILITHAFRAGDVELLAHRLAEVITELNLTNKPPEQRED